MERYEAALELLTPQDREAVIARIELGLTHPELARALGSRARMRREWPSRGRWSGWARRCAMQSDDRAKTVDDNTILRLAAEIADGARSTGRRSSRARTRRRSVSYSGS